MALDFKKWTGTFRETPGYNDRPDIIHISGPTDSTWSVLGVHKLTPAENVGRHHIYFEVLSAEGERDMEQELRTGWRDMREDQRPPPFTIDKLDYEPGNIPMYAGQYVFVEIEGGQRAEWFTTGLPDEAPGNTWGHHSFYVVFVQGTIPDPPDPPDSPHPPDTDPIGQLSLKVGKTYINTLPVDDQGNIEIVSPIYIESSE